MRRIVVKCGAPVTVLESSYDKVVTCEAEIVGKSFMLKKNGQPQTYGRTHPIEWILRPDGIHLGRIHLGTIPLEHYEVMIRCNNGHYYEPKPGEIIQYVTSRRR